MLICEEKSWEYYQTGLRRIYDSPQVRNRVERIAYLLRGHKVKGRTLAEIGFGNGCLLKLLHHEYKRTGYDISP